jgi:3-methylfumaryl-CoA hydratase
MERAKFGCGMQSLKGLRDWIGEKEETVDHVTIPMVHRLAATLDRDDPMPCMGDPLPYGWHLVLFPRVAPDSQLGRDGHPERGDFLPPIPLPRRMGAGRRMVFREPVRVGDALRRVSTIADVEVKEGRSGPLVLVTVSMEIHSPRGLSIHEEQQIIYRTEADPSAPPPPPQPAPGRAVWHRSVVPHATMVFRFSALSFNAHRIHYDHLYATGTEGYPGVVVPGNLHTVLVMELARTCAAQPVRFRSASWRNVRPLYVGRKITLCGEPAADGKSAKLWVMDDDDALSLAMTAELE